jgi:hypothetical protein
LAVEEWRAPADHDRADHQVQLIDQPMRQQVVPEGARLAIADEASPFAVRSTRYRLRAVIHLGCSISLAMGRVVPVTRVLDGVGRYSGGITVGKATVCLR